MSDAHVLLLFLLAPVLLALRWLVADRVPPQILLGIALVGGMVLLILWMAIELRNGAAAP
ncbi:MAG: hypothetical protein QOI38_671 [Sphingomonadales bacterium]|jgi:hypothetical protein|nr:hypothetical protein [Sphingomonadales bacterium]